MALISGPSPLAAPLPLPCGRVLPNRLAKAAMSEDMADRGHVPGERLRKVYGRWGRSGAGLVLTGNVMIDRSALGEPGNVVFDADTDLEAVRRWAEAGQANGATMWPQINHPGRQSPRFLSPLPVAPSAVPLALPGKVFATPRALEEAEIEAIVAAFGRAAKIARDAGFGGAQIHGAHGYLVSQFLSPLSNLREDGWGGDATRRRRFVVEVLRAMRREVGPDFPLAIKLNSADFQRGGFSEEESMEVVEVLEAEGLDLLEISGGTYEKPAMTGALLQQAPSGEAPRASTVAREAYFLEYARKVRARTKLPLMLTGGFRTRLGMEAAITEGAIDVVGLARPMALEPELPRGILDGTVEESRVEPKKTGVRMLDGLLEVAWYTHQIHRMGAGEEPDPRVWPWTVVGKIAWSAARTALGI